jgi:hypothetical protein
LTENPNLLGIAKEIKDTPPLPDYSAGTGICIKCGSTDPHSCYVWPNVTHEFLMLNGPFMARQCKTCDFMWPEKTKDGEPK